MGGFLFHGTFRDMAKNQGIRVRLDENREEIIARYRSGESTISLGKACGCSNASIWLALKRWGEELRQIQTREINRGEILRLHGDGHSASRIAKSLGTSIQTVSRALKDEGIDISERWKSRDEPLSTHREEITNRYCAGEGMESIAKTYSASPAGIRKVLVESGVAIKNLRDYSYPVDETFFDVIDMEAKAYILGFWMADGCNMPQIPCVSMSITDEDILLAMAREMKFDGPIKVVKPRKKGHRTQYSLKIGSRHMSDALVRVGCVRNKTYHATFPTEDVVPRDLTRHLIRGWLDGDGCITVSIKRKRCAVSIVGTEAACRGFSSACESHLGFPGYVKPVFKGKNHTTWTWRLSSHAQIRVFLEWLYRDATIFLKRKYDKYQEFLSLSPA